jgi:hypothetical protein
MTPEQMKQRIDDLEDALFSVFAHNTNIAHHKSCIENILRSLFTEKEFLARSQGGGRHPMYAEDIYKTLKKHFEPQ